MTTERDKQSEPRLLSDAEIDAVMGGTAGIHACQLALVYTRRYVSLLPPEDACPAILPSSPA